MQYGVPSGVAPQADGPKPALSCVGSMAGVRVGADTGLAAGSKNELSSQASR